MTTETVFASHFPGITWVSIADGTIELINSSWIAYTGCDRPKTVAEGFHSILHPLDLPSALASWERAVSTGTAGEIEARIRRNDDTYRWFLIHVTPIVDSNRGICKWHGYATDIDDLKCAQALLAGEKILLEMIADGRSMESFLKAMCEIVDNISPDSLITIGLTDDRSNQLIHTITSNLPRSFAEAIDGTAAGPAAFPCAAAMQGKTTLAITDIEADCPWPIYRDLARKHKLRACFITPILAPDGEVLGTFNLHALRPGEATAQQKSIIEQFTHLIGVAVKRKRMDGALHALQERFLLAAKASAEGIWDWDIEKNEMFMSLRAQRIFGLEPGMTIRTREDWRDRIKLHPDDVEPQLRMIESYLQGKISTYDGEWRIVLPEGGYRWVRLCGLCVGDANGKPTRLAGSVSDIDTQKRTEAALEQSRRLEALGTLAGGIAHDFNNILGVIIGYGEMASAEVKSGSRLERNVNRMLCASERGRALADRILAFSRNGMTEYTKVQVDAVVREAIDLICANLPPDIALDVQLNSGQAAMQGDQTQIHQVVVNLMNNAVQAMATGGTLSIHLDIRDVVATHAATTGLVEAGKYILLQVGDTGTGMDAVVMSRIFEPFFTTKEVGVGTGIGLSLVHNIVNQLGGAIDVVSGVGRGSTFSIYIPYAGDVQTINEVNLAPLPKGNGERIIIIDDEEALLLWSAEVLTELGYVVYSFTSSRVALEAFLENPGNYAVVITDERMPVLSGSSLIRELRKVAPSIPVVLMSGYVGEALQHAETSSQTAAILKKPLRSRDLAETLANVLRRSSEL